MIEPSGVLVNQNTRSAEGPILLSKDSADVVMAEGPDMFPVAKNMHHLKTWSCSKTINDEWVLIRACGCAEVVDYLLNKSNRIMTSSKTAATVLRTRIAIL